MLKVGITGGIGSGKTMVCRVFKALGIPVFNADEAARYLMEHDEVLIKNIKNIFGADIYLNGKLNANRVSAIVFNAPEKLQQLNQLVHPATIHYASLWQMLQSAPYTLKEAAIFFESGTYKEMDKMIGVFAPQTVRIKRAMKRSNLTEQEIISRINQQMDDIQKMSRCDFVIINDDITAVLPQVLAIHALLVGG